MKVAVLGAGVIGITTAYYLREHGHEVVVVDRQSNAAMETSFANAGDICPSYATPWAAPGMRWKAFKWLFQKHAPGKVRFRADRDLIAWITAWLGHCSVDRYRVNKPRMQRIARYSLTCLQALRERERIEYDHTTGGWTQLFRTRAAVDAASVAVRILEDAGIPHRLLDIHGLMQIDPALQHAAVDLAGGLHFPIDETGDCFKFTRALAGILDFREVEFKFDTRVTRIETAGERVSVVHTNRGTITADAYVVALATSGVPLLASIAIPLPIQPVKGFSITVPIVDYNLAPLTAVVDEQLKVAITRMGNRLRAAGTAEVGAQDVAAPMSACTTILRAVKDLYPKGVDASAPECWAGLRPMTPDGPPILGPTGYRNLFLNMGHGSNGWTQACGAGRVVADLVSGYVPEIDLEGLTLARYR